MPTVREQHRMNVYRKAIELTEQGRPFALAVVVKSSGSTPQKAGAKALFEPSGPIWGTLGGGCLEAESRSRALRALDEGKPIAFDLSLDEDYGWDDGLICGGRVRVLVEPRASRHVEAWKAAGAALERRERGWIETVFDGESVRVRWAPESEARGGAEDGEKPLYFVEAASEVFVEPVTPSPRLLIAGGGHIGQALAKLGAFLGFDVTVVDDRPAFTEAGLYPEGVRTVCGDIAELAAGFPGGPDAYIVIVTRGHRHDGEVLERCIRTPAAYLGMIGSRRKILLIRKQFVERGIATEEELSRVRSPMGLDIGSVTVPEIATSIAAELVAARRKPAEAGRPLSEKVPR
jgi:xanthine dehydrogenase accessory factor